MESNWATEHLQVIRTLMERSALYRRALAPVMIYNGIMGVIGAIAGAILRIGAPVSFILFWSAVAVVAVGGSLLLVRRQALRADEPFWSPPTRRVTQALLPPLAAGFAVSAIVGFRLSGIVPTAAAVPGWLWLPAAWVILYGCAFHAAGFFMPRGMRLFGWAFVVGGCLALAIGVPDSISQTAYTHGVMGAFFGALHLAYGTYLYFTEQRRNEP
jgi:hypothetical protein